MSGTLPAYTKETHIQFVKDMEVAKLPVRHYRGRNFYEGPAVEIDHVVDVLSNTKVYCLWDNLGEGFIVHPY